MTVFFPQWDITIDQDITAAFVGSDICSVVEISGTAYIGEGTSVRRYQWKAVPDLVGNRIQIEDEDGIKVAFQSKIFPLGLAICTAIKVLGE